MSESYAWSGCIDFTAIEIDLHVKPRDIIRDITLTIKALTDSKWDWPDGMSIDTWRALSNKLAHQYSARDRLKSQLALLFRPACTHMIGPVQ